VDLLMMIKHADIVWAIVFAAAATYCKIGFTIVAPDGVATAMKGKLLYLSALRHRRW